MTFEPRRNAEGNAAITSQDVVPRFRSVAIRRALVVCVVVVVAVFLGLGTWQLKRLQWKLDLIERVTQRAHAPAIAAPNQAHWPQVSAEADEYRHVRVTGTFLYPLTIRVQAVTELGSGFWLLTPLRTADSAVVLVNRGFIQSRTGDWRRQSTPDLLNLDSATDPTASGDVTFTGLLRMSEPGGAFLRDNDPAANRWYSRDVQAIAVARRLSLVAPYFVDADAAKKTVAPEAGAVIDIGYEQPIGGLTVIVFHNNHLVYAFTWYALAFMLAAVCFWGVREEGRKAGM
ncbi:MAG: SURF1 family protein [Glaciimonas sp.]|nr:SURF1 family protein [Glaciimonas sp.]